MSDKKLDLKGMKSQAVIVVTEIDGQMILNSFGSGEAEKWADKIMLQTRIILNQVKDELADDIELEINHVQHPGGGSD